MSRRWLVAVAAFVACAGCTVNTDNCNVKDACRTANGDAPVAPATPPR